MNVNCLNSAPFRGRTSITINRNDYEKSNEGKKLFPFALISSMGLQYAINKDAFQARMFDKNEHLSKGGKIATIAFGVAAASIIGGVIIDAFINGKRRNDADKFAKAKNAPDKTNKGKKVCALIGLGVSSLVALVKFGSNKISGISFTKAQKVLAISVTMAYWLGLGAIYDHGVNKFRQKLAEKAENN